MNDTGGPRRGGYAAGGTEVGDLPPRNVTVASEEECVLRGGHCFVDGDVMNLSNPPQIPQRCKHCGKRRVKVAREPWEYRDD